MSTTTTAATWEAEIKRTTDGADLVIRRAGEVAAEVWCASAKAALRTPQARQFTWRRSGAIGSSTLYRGTLRDTFYEDGSPCSP